MNCFFVLFFGMVDRRKVFSLISSQEHCQRSLSLQISDMPRTGFKPAQNLSSGLVRSCFVIIITLWRLPGHTRKACLFLRVFYLEIQMLSQEMKKFTAICNYLESIVEKFPIIHWLYGPFKFVSASYAKTG